MMKFCSYLKADLKRMLCSAKPFLSVILTVGVLLLATLEGIDLHAGVLYIFSLVMYGMPAMMILVCAAAAYADSFCEDVEHKYMMQQIIRGNVGAYVFARMSGIFLAAMFTTAFGIFLFVNFCFFQFTILHYYTDSIKQYAIAAQYPAAPWVLPFMGQNVYFQFVYGISVACFYSNVPYMPGYEMYVLMRQGRMWWVSAKLLRIWISAVMLVVTTFVLSILPLVPNLEWTFRWGKLYYSLALTDVGTVHHVKLFFRMT